MHRKGSTNCIIKSALYLLAILSHKLKYLRERSRQSPSRNNLLTSYSIQLVAVISGVFSIANSVGTKPAFPAHNLEASFDQQVDLLTIGRKANNYHIQNYWTATSFCKWCQFNTFLSGSVTWSWRLHQDRQKN